MYKNNNLTGKNSYTNPSLVVKPNIKPPEKEHPSTNRGLHNCNEGRFEQPYRESTDNYTTIIKKDPITGLFFAPNYSSSFADIISRLDYLGKSKLDATAIRDIDGLVFDKDYVHTDNNFTDAYKNKIDNFDSSSLEEIAILDAKVDGLTNTVNSNTSKISVNTGDISSLGTRVTTVKGEVDVLKATTEGLDGRISSQQTALDDLKSTVNRVDQDAGGAFYMAYTLRGDDIDKSARVIASEEVAKIVAGADSSFDTLKEIADWIHDHPGDATEINKEILNLKNNKVDKVPQHSLLADSEISRLATLNNYNDSELRELINKNNIAILNKVDKDGNKVLSEVNFTQADKNHLDSLTNYDDTNLSNLISSLKQEILYGDQTLSGTKTFTDTISIGDLSDGQQSVYIFPGGIYLYNEDGELDSGFSIDSGLELNVDIVFGGKNIGLQHWSNGRGTGFGFADDKYGTPTIKTNDNLLYMTNDPNNFLDDYIFQFPKTSGTIALTNDIPTKTSDLTNDSNFITGYTETDPTVPAHVKSIKATDIDNWNSKSTFNGDYNSLSNKPTIPTNTSQLTNDSDFANKTYVNEMVSKIEKFTMKVVNTLPTENISSSTIYLLSTDNDYPYAFEEYIYIDGDWELLGRQYLRLDDYVMKEDGKSLSSNDYTDEDKEKVANIPTKTSELENDAGFVTKNIIPNELNSKFAVSNSLDDLTANMTVSQINSANTGRIRGITYGNSKFVAVDQSGKAQYSEDNGNTWTLIDSFTSNPITSVTYGKGMFACIDYIAGGGNVYKSYDGLQWELVSTFTSVLESITYANGRFTLVGESGLVAFSDDLSSFAQPYTGATNNLIGITYGQNKYIAVSSAGQIIYSLDGITWYDCSIEGDTTHYRVATYGKGVFVIGGRQTINGVNTSVIRYSYDGLTWHTSTNNSTNTTSYVRSLAYYNGKFFVALQQGEIWTSIDGTNWEVNLSTSAMWAIACGNDVVLVGGESGLINRYNLNIDWLDYEPELNKNEVLWQKQFLTLSDGSIVESEVEVHTNMKNIYDSTLNGAIGVEYELQQGLNLSGKSIMFNNNFDVTSLPFGEIGESGYTDLIFISPSSSGYGLIATKYSSGDYTVTITQFYGAPAFPVEYLYRYGEWISKEYFWSSSETVGSFIENYNDYFKVVDKTKSLKEFIDENANSISNLETTLNNIETYTLPNKLDAVQIYYEGYDVKEFVNTLKYQSISKYYYNKNILASVFYYGPSNSFFKATVVSSAGITKWQYEGGDIVEITEQTPTTEELVNAVIEALPKYNGEVE